MQAIKRTIIGGLVFLLPIMVVILILEQAIDFAMLVAEPLSDIILLDMPGVILANLLAAGLVVCVCYIAGLIATSASVRALSERGDSFFNENLPGYMFVKMFIGSIMGPEEMEKDFEPIVYEVQNVRRIGFEVERSEDGWVTVFSSAHAGAVVRDHYDRRRGERDPPGCEELRRAGTVKPPWQGLDGSGQARLGRRDPRQRFLSRVGRSGAGQKSHGAA